MVDNIDDWNGQGVGVFAWVWGRIGMGMVGVEGGAALERSRMVYIVYCLRESVFYCIVVCCVKLRCCLYFPLCLPLYMFLQISSFRYTSSFVE